MNESWWFVHVYGDARLGLPLSQQVDESYSLDAFRASYADELVIDQPELIVRVAPNGLVTILYKEVR